MRLFLVTFFFGALVSCGGSSFKGAGKVAKTALPPSELDASNQSLPNNVPSLPGSDIPPGFSEAGRATLAKRFNDFLFGGAGPGSCGLPVAGNPCRAGGSQPITCPAGYANIGSVGDCFQLPPADAQKYRIAMQCNGNRPLCQKTGLDDPNVVIEVRMTDGSACPAGFSGDANGSNVLGVVSSPAACNNYSTSAFCKKIVPLACLPSGSSIVSAIAIMGTDSHTDSPPGCPAGFEEVGTAPDCSNYTGNKDIQCCTGRVRFCQKKEVVN